MKNYISRFAVILICLFVIYVTKTDSKSVTGSHNQLYIAKPLGFQEPADRIISDLKTFIPDYIKSEHIPGVQIALIHDGKTVWTEGFGVANKFTGKPVTSETLFEVASNSKVVTAYMALKLVDEGKISLEKPLHSYLTGEWLPPSIYRDSIKLQHVLSHSSGLDKTSRDVMFKPGTAYFYSANGFEFAKEVMQEVTGESFEELAQRLVFKPLGMENSSFVRQNKFVKQTSNGHLWAIVPFILFGISFTALFVVVFLISKIIIRIITKSWRIERLHSIIILSLSFILLSISIFIILGTSSLVEFAWFLVITGFIILSFFLLLFCTGSVFIRKKFPMKKGKRIILNFIWSLLIVVILLFSSIKTRNIPVPKRCNYEASAAGTLRTSASDLTIFLNEIANPQFLKPETAQFLKTPMIKLSDQLAWGMGPGILYSGEEYALWQWGQHVDFQSIMIIYPEIGFGVVVCTNSDLLNPDVALEIAHRALGGEAEPLRAAIHLQYDYREED